MTYRNRRPKVQYSIPMHLVQQLPVIREESYDPDYGMEVLPVRLRQGDRYLPDVTSVPRLPPLPTRGSRSPLKVDHASLGLLISDYLNYAREMNHRSEHLANVDRRQSCWCCSERNAENLRKSGHYGDYCHGPVKVPTDRFFDPLPEIATDIPEVFNPTDRWIPRREIRYERPEFRRLYVQPELWPHLYHDDVERFISQMAKSESFYTNHVTEADHSYRSSMKRLRNKVYDIGGL